eukprot:gnl/TRDRNA2_/TRDRNA2_177494_c6_seq6.p1 gnl/TRDRNA2_/TRDRNA2_177494_c6~~gnl/TRDRNA2_/TRDRNA2_177494_c6_seq6.p1  ORF type:complete len:205 (-),score=50.91 gnl/TRDRNA2_/TRDRNA2_177494_c6_seq6:298-912(-)
MAIVVPRLRKRCLQDHQTDVPAEASPCSAKWRAEFADFWGSEEAEGALSPRLRGGVNKCFLNTPRRLVQIISVATPQHADEEPEHSHDVLARRIYSTSEVDSEELVDPEEDDDAQFLCGLFDGAQDKPSGVLEHMKRKSDKARLKANLAKEESKRQRRKEAKVKDKEEPAKAEAEFKATSEELRKAIEERNTKIAWKPPYRARY